MSKEQFKQVLQKEICRIDESKTAKRHERVIDTFTEDHKAIIEGKPYTLFNSNDYLGLRFHADVHAAETEASLRYGAGPGAVRFISGTTRVYKDLEDAIASFHNREDAMVFSSAFAANLGVIHCMVKGQSKDALVGGDTLIVSDALNHRSIIDGIRVAGLSRENKTIFEHLNCDDLSTILQKHAGTFRRAIVVTDGIFSMLGESQDIKKLQEVTHACDDLYEEGVITIVDDAHGVGCFGETGRGSEEYTGGQCDLLVGTLGKGFGADGGYVTGDKIFIEYLRESAATYVYSNPFSPGTAGAALKAIDIVNGEEGRLLLNTLNENITLFKTSIRDAGFTLAVESFHAIQPILIGDPVKTHALTDALFNQGFLVTNISYPVVPKGRDEIRVQLSALHDNKDIEQFVKACTTCVQH
jgi:glycine C-acetyltransferase